MAIQTQNQYHLSEMAQKLQRSVMRELLKKSTAPGVISLAGGLPDSRLLPTEAYSQCLVNVLAREGVVPKNRAMELDRQRSMLAASLADDEGQLNRDRKQQEELSARINSHAYTLEQTEIRSPVDGAVVNLSVFTHGGVVAPGGKLMEIVPTDQPLVVEGQESGVGRWHTIKLATLSFFEYLQIKKIATPRLPNVASLAQIFDWSPAEMANVGVEARPLVDHYH